MELPVNQFKQAIKAGRPQIGIWSSLCSNISDGQRGVDMGYLFIAVGSDPRDARARD